MFIETEGNRMGDDPSHDSAAAVRRRPEGPTEVHQDFDSFYLHNRDQIARALSLSLRNADLGAEAADEAFEPVKGGLKFLPTRTLKVGFTALR